jgi:hypothetical protein
VLPTSLESTDLPVSAAVSRIQCPAQPSQKDS